MRRHHLKVRERSARRTRQTQRDERSWLRAPALDCSPTAASPRRSRSTPTRRSPTSFSSSTPRGRWSSMMDGCNVDTGLYLGWKRRRKLLGEHPLRRGRHELLLRPGRERGARRRAERILRRRHVAHAEPLGHPGAGAQRDAPRLGGRSLLVLQPAAHGRIGSSFANEYSYQYGTLGGHAVRHQLLPELPPPGRTDHPRQRQRDDRCAFGFQQGSTPAWNPSDTSGTGFAPQREPRLGLARFRGRADPGVPVLPPDSSPSSPAMDGPRVAHDGACHVDATCTMRAGHGRSHQLRAELDPLRPHDDRQRHAPEHRRAERQRLASP